MCSVIRAPCALITLGRALPYLLTHIALQCAFSYTRAMGPCVTLVIAVLCTAITVTIKGAPGTFNSVSYVGARGPYITVVISGLRARRARPLISVTPRAVLHRTVITGRSPVITLSYRGALHPCNN